MREVNCLREKMKLVSIDTWQDSNILTKQNKPKEYNEPSKPGNSLRPHNLEDEILGSRRLNLADFTKT